VFNKWRSYNPFGPSLGFQPGDVISYMEMCGAIGMNLQRGMNFRLRNTESVILMSLRPGAPYADQVEDEGRVLIYEGHDVARTMSGPHQAASTLFLSGIDSLVAG
jgi:hypothetical protein